MFIDEIKVYARAGHGGKGAVAFHREAYIPKGGPSGGNGGREDRLTYDEASVLLSLAQERNGLVAHLRKARLETLCGEHLVQSRVHRVERRPER